MGQTRCSVARPLEEAVPAGSRHDERPPRWDRVGRRRPPRPLPLGSGYLGGPRSGSSRLARPPRREVGACGRARTDGAEEIWRAAAPSELRCGVGCCFSPRVGRWQRRLQVNGAGPGRAGGRRAESRVRCRWGAVPIRGLREDGPTDGWRLGAGWHGPLRVPTSNAFVSWLHRPKCVSFSGISTRTALRLLQERGKEMLGVLHLFPCRAASDTIGRYPLSSAVPGAVAALTNPSRSGAGIAADPRKQRAVCAALRAAAVSRAAPRHPGFIRCWKGEQESGAGAWGAVKKRRLLRSGGEALCSR